MNRRTLIKGMLGAATTAPVMSLAKETPLDDYQLIGVSKAWYGVPVARVPHELIRKAQNPDLYPHEADLLATIQAQLASLK